MFLEKSKASFFFKNESFSLLLEKKGIFEQKTKECWENKKNRKKLYFEEKL